MLIPRRVKHRKQPPPRQRGIASGGTSVSFGDYGIQALEHAYITNRQIESARIAINRHIKRGGKVWINIFPDRPLTKKPGETRMGSGKGSPEWWIANVKPGRVLFELSYPNEQVARTALTRAIHKLPMKCRIVTREAGAMGWGRTPRNCASCTPTSSRRGFVRPRRSCSTSASRWPRGSWTTTGDCAPSATTSRG